MPRLLLIVLLVVSFSASAIVIRDDVEDSKYRVPDSEFPALADLPGEGHGALIAPRWVVTAAHAVGWQPDIKQIVLDGKPRDVARVVFHPGYRKPPQKLIDQTLATGDATLLVVALSASDDIALIELAQPVADVSPIAVYKGDDELGKVVELVGKGATGTGASGYTFDSPHRTQLRRAFNTVTNVDGRWLCYVFDKPSSGLPLEGMSGNGDSGGPALIQVDGQWELAGLTSWKVLQGDARTIRMGLYGQGSCNVRLSHYSGWIESVMAGHPQGE